MPYKKYNKRSYGRKRYYGRKMTGKKVASIAKRVVDKKIEMKEKTYAYTSVGLDPVAGAALSFSSVGYGGSAIVTRLCAGINRGTNDGERIGHKLTLKGVYVNFAIQQESGVAATITYNNIRFVLLRPRGRYTTSSYGALVNSIFNGNPSSATQWLTPIDTDYFQVYIDKKYNLKAMATGDPSTPTALATKFVKMFKKFNKKIQWDEQEGAPFSDIWLLAISDSAAIPNPGVVAGFVRLYYQDA